MCLVRDAFIQVESRITWSATQVSLPYKSILLSRLNIFGYKGSKTDSCTLLTNYSRCLLASETQRLKGLMLPSFHTIPHQSFTLRTLDLLLAHLIEESDTRHSPLESDVVHCPCGWRLLLYLAYLPTLMAGSRAFVILIRAFLFLLTLLLLHAVFSKSKN